MLNKKVIPCQRSFMLLLAIITISVIQLVLRSINQVVTVVKCTTSSTSSTTLSTNSTILSTNSTTLSKDPIIGLISNSSNCNGGDDGLCCLLPTGFTASSLWTSQLPEIMASSLKISQGTLTEDELKRLLYKIISPARLRRSIRSTPTNVASIDHIVEIVRNRIRSPKDSPPLKIAVFGGSVTIGRGCDKSKNRMMDKTCAWPYRFQELINSLIGTDLVEVVNMGSGGTSTGQGTSLVKYWMYPNQLKQFGPDIIINSYSANDSLPPYGAEPTEVIKKTRDNIWRSNQGFIRAALKSVGSCIAPPLVIHVDDYLGHQHDTLLGELQYNEVLTQLSRWYGTMLISYADVVRDLVYMDTSENTFSANWPIDKKNGEMKKDVHFQAPGHQIIAWALTFAAFDMASNYCTDKTWTGKVEEYSDTGGDDDTNNGLFDPIGALPPPLTDDTMLSTVSKQWGDAVALKDKQIAEQCSSVDKNIRGNPCVMAFTIGPASISSKGNFNQYMSKLIRENKGWMWEDNIKSYGWTNKLGWIANEAGAKVVIALDSLDRPVRVITLISMRSYGEKWEGSEVKLTATVTKAAKNLTTKDPNDPNVTSMHISGSHNVSASISHTDVMTLEGAGAENGDSMTLEIELVGGNTFKIQGLMICSY